MTEIIKKKKVLIVDDDSRNIFALTATLRRTFECVSFLDAREALNFLKGESDVHVILLDMMMPEMDGYEMIPLIKAIEKHKKTPVVAVTAQAMVGDKEKCLRAGADNYLSKPVDVDKLLSILSVI